MFRTKNCEICHQEIKKEPWKGCKFCNQFFCEVHRPPTAHNCQKLAQKCARCGSLVGIEGIKCNFCGDVFCTVHEIPDSHGCANFSIIRPFRELGTASPTQNIVAFGLEEFQNYLSEKKDVLFPAFYLGTQVWLKIRNQPNRGSKVWLIINPLNTRELQLLRDVKVSDSMDPKERADWLRSVGWDKEEAKRIWKINGENILVNGTIGMRRLDRIQGQLTDLFNILAENNPKKNRGLKVIIHDAIMPGE